MSRDSKFSRLCRLISHSLDPYLQEPEIISLTTKEIEKDLLISLSEVLTEIQTWIHQLDFDSPEVERRCYSGSELHHIEHNCLIKILANLMLVLRVESQHVQHLVGNILVDYSKFVATSGIEWDSFIHVLCTCLELAISNMVSCPWEPLRTGAEDSNCDSVSVDLLKSSLKGANWSTAAGFVQVLRNILKYMKQERDDQLLEVFFGSVGCSLSNVPWYSMDEIRVCQRSHTWDRDPRNCGLMGASVFRSFGQKEPKVLFLGSFIQFLCSLVEQSSAVESEVDSKVQNPVLSIINSLIPKLAIWCFGKKGKCVKQPVSWYFRHKLLMLMLKLSYETCLCNSTLISWLQLLHEYFEELLQKPIINLKADPDQCLEGSPFLSCLAEGEVSGTYSLHLQRQTVLLFLRCCFCLISFTGETSKQCMTSNPTHVCYLTFDSLFDLDCCGRKKGLLELYNWLQWHLPDDIFVDHESYLEKCMGFSSSFLKLYMHEDDMLFKVLLQLLSVPFCSEQWFAREMWTSLHVKDVTHHVSNLFNPVYLFHLFLAELHYDHQVLLDYLISKDIGIICAEYLLRCLRTVYKSWDLFVKFSMDGKVINKSYQKRRRLSLDVSDLQDGSSTMCVKSIPQALGEEHKVDTEYVYEHQKNKRQPFKEAKNCLLSLKARVESLHLKNLFPYNPEVLLRRCVFSFNIFPLVHLMGSGSPQVGIASVSLKSTIGLSSLY